MTALLVVISILLALMGGMMLSQATAGVGLVCIGIAFCVLARINQAAEYRREQRRERESRADAAPLVAAK